MRNALNVFGGLLIAAGIVITLGAIGTDDMMAEAGEFTEFSALVSKTLTGAAVMLAGLAAKMLCRICRCSRAR